ncbi:hypothetical protein D3C87_2084340 [compost metagenome]
MVTSGSVAEISDPATFMMTAPGEALKLTFRTCPTARAYGRRASLRAGALPGWLEFSRIDSGCRGCAGFSDMCPAYS